MLSILIIQRTPLIPLYLNNRDFRMWLIGIRR